MRQIIKRRLDAGLVIAVRVWFIVSSRLDARLVRVMLVVVNNKLLLLSTGLMNSNC